MINSDGVKIGISSFGLKLIAVFSMLADHICKILFVPYLQALGISDPQSDFTFCFLNIAGRLAFPVFCFLVSEGAIRSSNRVKYFIRLLVFALASEIPFNLAFSGSAWDRNCSNAMFTLLLGLLLIMAFDAFDGFDNVFTRLFAKAVSLAIICLLSVLIRSDYSAFGVILILLFYLFRKNEEKRILYAALWIVFGIWVVGMPGTVKNLILGIPVGERMQAQTTKVMYEIPGLLALFPIKFYNKKKGAAVSKYLFSAFYPLHLLILYMIRCRLFGRI